LGGECARPRRALARRLAAKKHIAKTCVLAALHCKSKKLIIVGKVFSPRAPRPSVRFRGPLIVGCVLASLQCNIEKLFILGKIFSLRPPRLCAMYGQRGIWLRRQPRQAFALNS
jgi:hypothetical protein